ncbi:hypothetical protein V2S66_03300 [Streptomyces sp. V4-01]|uniref:Uncharacterized protein n=1 Tax=Actinacidiphila polyblastidii TaxID=3110430 RepID=A0ABU7P6P5_9ACTN|nr:hypothetical protein [Streptomyces sp. V4-01]
MSWLELLCFVEGLPADSATKAALAGDTEGRRWTDQDWMAAYTASLLQTLIRIQWAGHGIKGSPTLHPVDVPTLERPPSDEDVRRAERRQQQLQQLARMRPRGDARSRNLAALDAALKARQGSVTS